MNREPVGQLVSGDVRVVVYRGGGMAFYKGGQPAVHCKDMTDLRRKCRRKELLERVKLVRNVA